MHHKPLSTLLSELGQELVRLSYTEGTSLIPTCLIGTKTVV